MLKQVSLHGILNAPKLRSADLFTVMYLYFTALLQLHAHGHRFLSVVPFIQHACMYDYDGYRMSDYRQISTTYHFCIKDKLVANNCLLVKDYLP